MRDAEASHAILFVVTLAIAAHAAGRTWWPATGWTLLFDLVLNGCPVVLQRYNRARGAVPTASTRRSSTARSAWPPLPGLLGVGLLVRCPSVGQAGPVQPSFVVMSGLPASGKSTLGRRLSGALDLPLIDKDDLLEQRFRSEATVAPAERARLSRLADVDFERAGLASRGAVLVSFWRRAEVSTTSGTPIEWLASLPDMVEVHCVCPPATAVARFLARSRHAGHGDGRASGTELLCQFQALERLGPLGLAPVVVVDSERQPNMAAVLDAVRALR
jgi:hypothetical protein